MDEQLPDTTRCYAAGCNRENEILMHLSENPTAFADLCWEHAHEAFRSTPLTWTCDCAFCQRARSVLGGSRAGDAASDAAEPVTQGEHEHPADMLLCPACQPGEWIIETASASQYVLDSRDRSAVTVVRLPDAGGGAQTSHCAVTVTRSDWSNHRSSVERRVGTSSSISAAMACSLRGSHLLCCRCAHWSTDERQRTRPKRWTRKLRP